MNLENHKEQEDFDRKPYLDHAKRVVVKVGSAVVTSQNGLDRRVLKNLAGNISYLCERGIEVILVSSGAVAAGQKRLGVSISPDISLKEKQAAAAVGQSSLMQAYEEIFSEFGHKVAQVLLTHNDLSHRDRYLNARNTILTLLGWGIIPVVNENDTVSVKELRFGDNDTLGSMITNLIEADLFICLTDVDGLFTGNPHFDSGARQVYTVEQVDNQILQMANNVFGALGSGGMQSKILAAESVSVRGGGSFIGSGRRQDIIKKLFAGQPVGTFFLPRQEKMQSRKHWIAYVLRPKGYLVIDTGACRALTTGGKSLLPSGIIEVRGKFKVGASVQCIDEQENPIAAGLTNYGAVDLEKIKGLKSSEIENVLGFKDSDEVIHRDNLVVLQCPVP